MDKTILGDIMSEWKEILKYQRVSGRLRRYMGYANASKHNIHDRMTMEQFAERVHNKMRAMAGAYETVSLIEEKIFDEINQLDINDPKMPFDIPFDYGEYMEQFGNAINEERERDINFLESHQEMVERKREKRKRKLLERQGSDYWAKRGPKPLRSPKTEEE